jgi:hypothetical protein
MAGHNDDSHNEFVCHATGERRYNLLNQIKHILTELDDTPCTPEGITGEGKANGLTPSSRRKPSTPPMIVNVPIHETRMTSEFKMHKNEIEKKLDFIPVDLKNNPHASPPWQKPR